MTLVVLPQRPIEERALQAVDDLLVFARNRVVKASADQLTKERDELIAEQLPKMTAELVAYFRRFADRWLPKTDTVEKASGWSVDDVDWEAAEQDLYDLMLTWYELYGRAAFEGIASQLGVDLAFDLGHYGVKRVLEQVAQRVTGITDVSRRVLAGYVERAVEAGSSTQQLADTLAGVLDTWGQDGGRAYTIALTESAAAYNLSSLAGYRDSGIVDQVQIFDGTECGWTSHDDPDLADGSIRDLDDAEAYPTAHPNCQRSWAPVVAR